MRLYPIYKNLFESYDHLITEELLDEVQWQTSKETKLKDGEIPLTPTIVKFILGERVKEGYEIDDDGYDYISDEAKHYYITSVKNRRLSSHQLNKTPDNLAMIYLKQRLDQGWNLTNYEQVRYNKLKGNSSSVNESRRIIKNILRGK
jgi:hypothetical protein